MKNTAVAPQMSRLWRDPVMAGRDFHGVYPANGGAPTSYCTPIVVIGVPYLRVPKVNHLPISGISLPGVHQLADAKVILIFDFLYFVFSGITFSQAHPFFQG